MMGDFNRGGKKRFGRGDSGRFGMGVSERFDRGNSRGKFGKKDFERPNISSEERRMYEATCDRCGNKCELPFRPRGGKPVYCSDCFRKNEHSDSRNQLSPSSGELEQINLKLDKIMRALEIN